jgi:hypothetical protein
VPAAARNAPIGAALYRVARLHRMTAGHELLLALNDAVIAMGDMLSTPGT